MYTEFHGIYDSTVKQIVPISDCRPFRFVHTHARLTTTTHVRVVYRCAGCRVKVFMVFTHPRCAAAFDYVSGCEQAGV